MSLGKDINGKDISKGSRISFEYTRRQPVVGSDDITVTSTVLGGVVAVTDDGKKLEMRADNGDLLTNVWSEKCTVIEIE
jgi:hypothetical protein